MKIILAGGTGYLGKLLQNYFSDAGHQVVVFSRSNHESFNNVRFVKWDGETLDEIWVSELRDSNVIINLSGRTVNCKYNEKNKKEILDSRVNSTRVLGLALERVNHNLELWINFASATIYKHSLADDMTDETGELGNGFSVGICKAWEEEFYNNDLPIRKVALRLAMVMGKNDGPLVPLLGLSKVFLGGKQGRGDQYVSWLSENDFVGIIDYVINNVDLEGSINACSPNPEPNHLFMKHVRESVNRKFGFHLRNWMLEVGAFFMQTETELVKKSRRVVPSLLLNHGFKFKDPDFGSYVKNL